MKSGQFIQSIEKAFSILDLFASEKSELSLTKIAGILNMPLGTAHRYINTLAKLGYIIQDSDTKKYRITPKIIKLGSTALEGLSLRKRVLPFMVELVRDFDVTTQCGILDENEVVYIERVRNKSIVNLDFDIGSRFPAHCTSLGKVLLAFTDNLKRQSIIAKANLTKMTPYTITSKEMLFKELNVIKSLGYATSNQELNQGLYGLAVPIFNNGVIEASLGVSMLHDINSNQLFFENILGRLKAISQDVSL